MSQESQNERILAALRSGRKLSPLEALNDFGTMRLGGRIYDLKKAGIPIEDEWWETPTGKRVKRYFIPEQPSLI